MENSGKSAFSASPDHKDKAKLYAAYIKNKGNKNSLHFDDWAKLQTCHYCGNTGHVKPQCRKYLAAKANGTLPSSSEKRSNVPPSAPPMACRDKFMKDPKLKALFAAFLAFTTDYLAESQATDNGEVVNRNDHGDDANIDDENDDINAFLGMVGVLKE
jgi:hypothetical protein